MLQCSVTCGNGIRTRIVECRNVVTSATVSEDFCNLHDKPSVTESCSLPRCLAG